MDDINFNIQEHFTTPEILLLIKKYEEENEFVPYKENDPWKCYTFEELLIAKVFHIGLLIVDDIIKYIEKVLEPNDYYNQDFTTVIKINNNYYKIKGTSNSHISFADYNFKTLKQVFPVEKTIIVYE